MKSLTFLLCGYAANVAWSAAAIVGTPALIDDGGTYTAEAGSNRVVACALARESTTATTPSVSTLAIGTATLANAKVISAVEASQSSLTGRLRAGVWYVKEANIDAGAMTISATWSTTMGGASNRFTCYTLSGVNQSSSIDNTATAVNTAGTTHLTGTIAVADHSVQVLAAGVNTTNSSTPDSPWTEIRDVGDTDYRAVSHDNTTSTAATLNFGLNFGGSNAAVAAAASFAPASSSSAPAAWSFVSAGTVATSNGSSSLTPGLPAGHTTGDHLIWVGRERNSGAAVALPAGYTELYCVTNASVKYFCVADKIDSGSESAPSTTAVGVAIAQLAAFRGGPTSLAGLLHASATSGTTCTTTPPTPALTITQAGTLALDISSQLDNYTGFTSNPSGFSAVDHNAYDGVSDLSLLWAYQVQTSASSLTADNFTTSGATSNTCRGISLALTPATTGGTISITSVDGDNAVTAAQQNVVIAVAGAGSSAGTVQLVDGSITQTLSQDSWSDTSIQVDVSQGNVQYGAKILRVTNALGAVDEKAITLSPESGECYFNLGTLATFATDSNGAPNRFGGASSDISNNAQLHLYNLAGVSNCNNITVNADGTYKMPTGLTSLKWRWHNGTAWQGSASNDRTGQGKVKIVASGAYRKSAGFDAFVSTPGADITVCASGCDFGVSQANVDSAIAAATAGKIVEFRADTPGGTKTLAVRLDFSSKAGSSGNPITFRVRSGDTIILKPVTSNEATTAWADVHAVAAVDLESASYVTLDGFEIGDIAEWSVSSNWTGVSAATSWDHRMGLAASSCNHIILKNMKIHGARRYSANLIRRDCTDVYLVDTEVSLHGTNNLTSTGGPWGDLLLVNSPRTVLRRITGAHAGHSQVQFLGPYQIVEDSTFDGNWADKSTGYPGQRAFEIWPSANNQWEPTNVSTGQYGPTLAQRNIFRRAAQSVDRSFQPCIKAYGIGVILRENGFQDCAGPAMQFAGFEGTTSTSKTNGNSSIYNNTGYALNGVFRSSDNQAPAGAASNNMEGYLFANNLWQQIDTGLNPAQASQWDTNAISFGSFTDCWRNSVFTADIYGGPSTAMQFTCSGAGAIAGATKSVTDSTTWPTRVFDNLFTTLTFSSVGSAGSRPLAGFALTAGNLVGLGDAVALTTTTDSGASDTTLKLANPYPFKDDWGMGADDWPGGPEINGDWIYVAPTNGGAALTAVCTQIQSINYATGDITVLPAVTHAVGSGVWYGGDGDTCGLIRDNRGAVQ